jgi:hypothetical protein
LTVAEKAGQRYAAAARARAQGDLVLYSDWLTAAQASAALVADVHAQEGTVYRAGILSEAYSLHKLALADSLAADAVRIE